MSASELDRPISNPARTVPSIFSVNLLYLVTMLLMAVLGSAMQSLHFTWGLIASEALLVLLPSIIFLRLRRIPLKDGIRLEPIRPLVGFLCFLLGFATFLFGVIFDSITPDLTGMVSVPIFASSMPTGASELISYFIAVAIVAPLCEEPLFRGVMQRAYEHRRTSFLAITVVALMFVFFHFRVSGLLGLLSAAFILGFVAWQTGSIYASLLAHFGLNAPAAVRTLLALSSGKGLPFLSLPVATLALGAMSVLIFLIRRLQPAREPQPIPRADKSRSWLRDYSPLIVASLLYLWVAGSGLAAALLTGQITLERAGYDPVRIDQALESRYAITNRAGDDVGELNCTITQLGPDVSLECTGKVRGYDVNTGSGHFQDQDHTIAWSATWNANNLDLIEFSLDRSYEEPGRSVRAALEAGRLVVEDSEGAQDITLSPGDLVEYEWAWRINALRPQFVTSIQAPFAHLLWWDDQTRMYHPAVRTEILRLGRAETINVPAGQFLASKATLGGQEALYARDHAGPVSIDDGELVYRLEK